MGDKSFKKNEVEIEQDLDREEQQVSKIRDLKKERNKKRAEISRIHGAAPCAKRRKTGEDSFEIEQNKTRDKLTTNESEKRKDEKPQESPAKDAKRRKLNRDVKEMLTAMAAKQARQEEQQEGQDKEKEQTVHYSSRGPCQEQACPPRRRDKEC